MFYLDRAQIVGTWHTFWALSLQTNRLRGVNKQITSCTPKHRQMGNVSKITCDLFNVCSGKAMFSQIVFLLKTSRVISDSE